MPLIDSFICSAKYAGKLFIDFIIAKNANSIKYNKKKFSNPNKLKIKQKRKSYTQVAAHFIFDSFFDWIFNNMQVIVKSGSQLTI